MGGKIGISTHQAENAVKGAITSAYKKVVALLQSDR
jgi:hypothetical protein